MIHEPSTDAHVFFVIQIVYLLEDHTKSDWMQGRSPVFSHQCVQVIGCKEGHASKADFPPDSIPEIVQIATDGFFFLFPARPAKFTIDKLAPSSQSIARIRTDGHSQTIPIVVVYFSKIPAKQRKGGEVGGGYLALKPIHIVSFQYLNTIWTVDHLIIPVLKF